MEFPFDLNALLPERISVLDSNLSTGRKAQGRPDPLFQITTVIDELGKASSKAQQLPAPITSAAKLQANRQHLYLLKDGEQNGGRGVVMGFLKVGCKKLFLLDQRGAHVETEPLCVLDFYVAETLQRHGYGLELFDFMLKHKQVEPEQMAYDRPSPKFLSFLDKHYDLKNSVPQVNNFVVFTGFFQARSVAQLRKVPPKRPEGEIKPYSLMEREVFREEQRALPWPFVHPKGPPLSPPLLPPAQQSRSLSVGSSPSHPPIRPVAGPAQRLQQAQNNGSCRARRTSLQGLVARGNLYSRHINSQDVGQLLAEQQNTLTFPGLGAELYERVSDTGAKADAEKHKHASERCQISNFATSQKAQDETSTKAEPQGELINPVEDRRKEHPELPRAGGRGWSWTV
ncbi:hypothetical protein DNTS_026379, partial [Danionella cerebrum]